MAALILAGRRGPNDPLAEAAGAPHRAFLDIGGEPMLARVVRTLEASPGIGSIQLSIDAPELLGRYPGLSSAVSRGALEVIPSERSPARSVLSALDAAPTPFPLLLTTADHALLEPELVGRFLEAARDSGADLAVGLVSRSVLEARFPESRRTYLPFRGESYSGANLFAILTPRARRAVEFWLGTEQYRKRPWRLVSAFGLGSLLLFLLRRLDLEAAFERASRVLGLRAVPIVLPVAEAAVDVDKLDDLVLVRRILAEREAASKPPTSLHSSERSPSSTNLPPSGS